MQRTLSGMPVVVSSPAATFAHGAGVLPQRRSLQPSGALKLRARRWLGLVCVAVTATACSASEPESASGWRVHSSAGLSTPRAAHTTTVISAGRVLVTGGCSGSGCMPVERTAELLDIASGRSQATQPMAQARVAHAAVLLDAGRVLVAGGWSGEGATASAEVFDPRWLAFTPVPPMATARMDAAAVALRDGSVLITGGADAIHHPLAQAEVFDPAQGRFVVAGAMQQARAHHAAVRLRDGRVLVVGGQRGRHLATASAELYDPATASFVPTGSMQQPRCKHAAVLLSDGRVMVIAGSSDCDDRRRIAQTEVYDPGTGQFSAGPMLMHPRYKIVDAVAVLPGGEVVVAGDAADVEVWVPGTPAFVRAGGIGDILAFSTATPLPQGRVWVLGGYDNEVRPTAQGWLIERTAAVRGLD